MHLTSQLKALHLQLGSVNKQLSTNFDALHRERVRFSAFATTLVYAAAVTSSCMASCKWHGHLLWPRTCCGDCSQIVVPLPIYEACPCACRSVLSSSTSSCVNHGEQSWRRSKSSLSRRGHKCCSPGEANKAHCTRQQIRTYNTPSDCRSCLHAANAGMVCTSPFGGIGSARQAATLYVVALCVK